ncbi:MAG: hypothetical protein R3C45_14500 [Phycisphaerales bacterium]
MFALLMAWKPRWSSPSWLTTVALDQRWKKATPRAQLQKWMTEDQGWVLHDSADLTGVQEDRINAQVANYCQNKPVFHESLLRRYGSTLNRSRIPDHVDTAEQLRLHLEGLRHAQRHRGLRDRFSGTTNDIGSRSRSTPTRRSRSWRMLIEQVREFDFSKLDYEIIKAIFERLISPEERHKYGQYYTRRGRFLTPDSIASASAPAKKASWTRRAAGTFCPGLLPQSRELNFCEGSRHTSARNFTARISRTSPPPTTITHDAAT